MSETKILTKLTSPHKITLYLNGQNPNIYYYFTLNRKSYRGSTGVSDLKLSTDRVFEIFYEIKKGKKRIDRSSNRFEEVCKKYLKYQSGQSLSSRTMTDYKRQSRFLLEKFRGRDIETLCSRGIYDDYRIWREKYYETHETKRRVTYKRDGKVFDGRTINHVGNVPINRECRLPVSILRYSKSHLDLLSGVDIPSYKMLRENRREDVLTKEEYLRLEEYWMNNNPYYWTIISFVNNTGIRYPSELLKILWKDVHLDKSYVLIRDRKNRKSKEPLNTPVPLVGTSKDIIEKLWSRENISKGPNDFVFVNDKGVQVKNIQKSFKTSLRKCGLNEKITMYGFRHLYTTRMVKRSDIPLTVLSKVLGHKDTTMISKHYEHLRTEDLVKVFQESENHKQQIVKSENELHERSKP